MSTIVINLPEKVSARDYHEFDEYQSVLKKFGAHVIVRESGFDAETGLYWATVKPDRRSHPDKNILIEK